MLASDWSKVAGVPADLVRAGVAISGVFDLAPLIPTSINDLVRLDETSARAASPLLWPPPPKGRTLVAAVGGDESSEFLRQSRVIAETWARAGLKTECLVVPGTDHFTVVDELTKPTSALFGQDRNSRAAGKRRLISARRGEGYRSTSPPTMSSSRAMSSGRDSRCSPSGTAATRVQSPERSATRSSVCSHGTSGSCSPCRMCTGRPGSKGSLPMRWLPAVLDQLAP